MLAAHRAQAVAILHDWHTDAAGCTLGLTAAEFALVWSMRHAAPCPNRLLGDLSRIHLARVTSERRRCDVTGWYALVWLPAVGEGVL